MNLKLYFVTRETSAALICTRLLARCAEPRKRADAGVWFTMKYRYWGLVHFGRYRLSDPYHFSRTLVEVGWR